MTLIIKEIFSQINKFKQILIHDKLITIFLIFNIIFSDTELKDYIWPTDASNTITTVFGDKRSRRFHAGIDVRTYGQIGHDIYAISSGYISRIVINPNGYGKALYLQLNDGNTVLYAHLDSFSNKIEKFVEEYRKSKNINFIDVYVEKNLIQFEKGDIIGTSGDTGSLSGAHLHFEIRNQFGNPINPLMDIYSIKDTINPAAKSLTIIPFDSTCYINGIQNYVIYDLKQINDTTYILNDTLSVIGNFGIGIEINDEVNNQPFNFGIYQIELLIDNRNIYNIIFDEYSFKNDYLIYKELDYALLSNNSRKFHRLFENHTKDLNFIKQNPISAINLDEGYHNITIIAKDINNNNTYVNAVIKGDIILPPKINIINNNGTYFIKSDTDLSKFTFDITTRYKDGIKSNIPYTIIDSNLYSINEGISSPFEILEYKIKDKGLTSRSEFISLKEPMDYRKITGDFNYISIDKGIILQFEEDFYSGYNCNFKLVFENKEIILDTYRSSKTTLSSNIINYNLLNNVKMIIAEYDSNPIVTFEDKINGFYISNTDKNSVNFKNFVFTFDENSFYNDTFLWFEDTTMTIDKYKVIHKPINIFPKDMPFKNYIDVYYDNLSNELSHFGLYSYNGKDWSFESKNIKSRIKSKISSGGIYAVLTEDISPVVKNITPAKESTYRAKDLKELTFNYFDKLSGINHHKTYLKIDGEKYYFDAIKYRKMIRAEIKNQLRKGEHFLEIHIEDNLGNSTDISYNFFIK